MLKVRSWDLKTAYFPQDYLCEGENGSLKVGNRGELYCPTCKANGCVFGGPTLLQKQAVGKVVPAFKSAARSRAALKGVARLRAKGLSPRGESLVESCWNCESVRRSGPGFVCQFRPASAPVTRMTMSQRRVIKSGCQSFEVRLVMEIMELGRE